jgi:hypothetical protein
MQCNAVNRSRSLFRGYPRNSNSSGPVRSETFQALEFLHPVTFIDAHQRYLAFQESRFELDAIDSRPASRLWHRQLAGGLETASNRRRGFSLRKTGFG